MKKLFGVAVAMTTPFRENGSINFAAIEQHTEMLISKKVHCLYPCGTTGEMLRMTTEERKEVAATIIKVAAGRLPVYIQCGATTEDATIDLVKHAREAGADGVGVVTPQFFGLSEREMVSFYVRVSQAVPDDFPIYLYNIPQCAANDITPKAAEMIAAKAKNIIGIKYSFADINRTLDYLRINNWQFSVMHGSDRVFVAMKALGCDGTISGISCVFPEPFVNVYSAILRNDWEGAKQHQRNAARVTDILKAGSNMSYFKEALKIRGLTSGYMRKPQLDIATEEVGKLREELEIFCADTGYVLKA